MYLVFIANEKRKLNLLMGINVERVEILAQEHICEIASASAHGRPVIMAMGHVPIPRPHPISFSRLMQNQ